MVVEGLTSVHQWPFKLKPVVMSNMVVCEIKNFYRLWSWSKINWKSTVIFHTSASPGNAILHVHVYIWIGPVLYV